MATSAAMATSTQALISEKTVELNLTLEVVNWLGHLYGHPTFAWGPTLRQEARWGFDAAIGLHGRLIYLQYKRAYLEGAGHLFHLNRTSARDQHQKLQALEAAGLAVRYALPRFTTLGFIAAHRKRLLRPPHTAWIRPMQITMPNNGVGHHDLHVHPGRRWLTSDPVEVDPSDDFPFEENNLDAFTSFTARDAEYWPTVFDEIFGEDPDATRGAAILFMRC